MESPDIFVLDKMGELARIYGLGDVAVVAGSFCRIGGHNVLEAAAHSIPVVVGPHMHAQKELDRLFQAPDSGCVRCDADNLGRTLAELFRDEGRRREIGALARRTATRNQGSARKSIEILKRYL
jgi:3-deoxy-D-manno-octulosonic-acid transferase